VVSCLISKHGEVFIAKHFIHLLTPIDLSAIMGDTSILVSLNEVFNWLRKISHHE
jgi:hypothetical protein